MFVRESNLQWQIFGVPWLLAMIYGFMAPLGPIVITAFLLLIFGSILVITSKISSKKRTAVTIEFGYKNMSSNEKIRYVLGYILMTSSILGMALQGVFSLR